jgi:hypothetical protein
MSKNMTGRLPPHLGTLILFADLAMRRRMTAQRSDGSTPMRISAPASGTFGREPPISNRWRVLAFQRKLTTSPARFSRSTKRAASSRHNRRADRQEPGAPVRRTRNDTHLQSTYDAPRGGPIPAARRRLYASRGDDNRRPCRGIAHRLHACLRASTLITASGLGSAIDHSPGSVPPLGRSTRPRTRSRLDGAARRCCRLAGEGSRALAPQVCGIHRAVM